MNIRTKCGQWYVLDVDPFYIKWVYMPPNVPEKQLIHGAPLIFDESDVNQWRVVVEMMTGLDLEVVDYDPPFN